MMRIGLIINGIAAGITILLIVPANALAMHISEGILPVSWAVLWYVLSLPFIYWGIREIKEQSKQMPWFKPYLGLVGAAVFIISCMPVPVPFASTCSHPCGTGLASIFIGPILTILIASIALLIQALFLAHGGLTSLGANVISMGVIGAFVGYGVFKLSMRIKIPWAISVFLAGVFSDWATYGMTSFELASALAEPGQFKALFYTIIIAFVPTQLPLGILEGFLCMGAYRFIKLRRPELIKELPKGGVV